MLCVWNMEDVDLFQTLNNGAGFVLLLGNAEKPTRQQYTHIIM